MIWNTGNISISGAGTFTNTGTFDDQVDGTFGSTPGTTTTFNNQGLFLKSGGSGVTNLQIELDNSGLVRVVQGVLNLGGGYVQAPASSGSNGGSISGSVSGAVSNPGQLNVAPSAAPPPVLTSYTQTATGTFFEQIGGLTPQTQFGQLIVTGTVTLAGSLQ